jgi:2-polyprenyl-3-methyl-5-hydroxy-6-metoxy-1,4-benzoquinol methylase
MQLNKGASVQHSTGAVRGIEAPAQSPNEQTWSETREAGGCILCGGPLEKQVSNLFDTRFGLPGRYEARRCLHCSLEQIFPVPSLEKLKSIYESHYNFGGEKNTLYTQLRERFLFSSLNRIWERMDGDISFHQLRGAGRLLDIGCNEGRNLRIYARNGFQAEGLELNETAAAEARKAGFDVHTCLLGDYVPAAPYDVAVLSNVLEHVPDPLQMLLDSRRILSTNGRLWISCPNSQSWLRNVFGKYWINWHVPFHISQFSPQTVTTLVEKAGFTRIEIHQVTPALWVAMSIIAKMFAKEGHPTRQLRNPLLVVTLMLLIRFAAFPVLWLQNKRGRGDCLLITASKA